MYVFNALTLILLIETVRIVYLCIIFVTFVLIVFVSFSQ